jgi:hypothetical protein
MDINKFKIIKELGHGMIGTVFLAKYKNKKYALKIEHILEEDRKKSSSSQIWREIFFSTKFANKYPEQFIKLYSYDIIDNCTHKQEYSMNVEMIRYKKIRDKIYNIAKSNLCIRKVYSLIDGVLDDVIDLLSHKQLYSFILQYSYIILLLQKNGYSHGDIHGGNIGYIKTKKKFVKILNYNIPTYGYIFKFIDYGFVKNKKNKLSNENREFHKKFFTIEGNLSFIYSLLYDDYNFYNYLIENKINYNDEELYLNFLKSVEFDTIKYLSNNDYNCFLIYKILFIEKYQKSILKKKFKKVIEPIIRGDLSDILYFLKFYGNIYNIINYFTYKINL